MSAKTFLILSLAAWRLSSLLVDESGPFEVFDHLRARAGVAFDARNKLLPYEQQGELARLFICMWCMSVWVGLGLAVAHRLAPKATEAACLPLALSAMALLAEIQASRPVVAAEER